MRSSYHWCAEDTEACLVENKVQPACLVEETKGLRYDFAMKLLLVRVRIDMMAADPESPGLADHSRALLYGGAMDLVQCLIP